MRKTSMKSLFVAMLLLLVLALAACTGGGNGDDTTAPATTAPVTTQAPVTTAPDAPAVKPVVGYTPDIGDFTLTAIAGLEEYTIVYPELADEEIIALANALRDAIAEKTGVTLAVKSDFVGINEAVPAGAKEIRVGITNRDDYAYLRVNDYRIEADGAALVLAARNADSLEAAVEAYTSLMLADSAKLPDKAYWYQAPYQVETLLLGGADISKYVIVRDSENAMVADFLRDKIAAMTGYVLPVHTNLMPEEAYEIVIGNIARAGFVAPEMGAYAVKQIGPKVMLGGTGPYAGYFATVDFIENTLVNDTTKTGQTLTLSLKETEAPHSMGGLFTLNLPDEFGSMEGKYNIIYSAQTVLDRFLATRDELPDEVTVLERFELEDYPFSQSYEIFVSPDGDDANEGTKEEPLKTLTTALTKMANRKGGVIWMMGGYYSVDATINLSAAHSGTATSPLFIKAYEDQEVILSSNKKLDTSPEKWSYLDGTEPLYDRIPEEARLNVRYTTLAQQGWTPADIPAITKQTGAPSLYVGGDEYVVARFPNETIDNRELLYFTKAYDTGTVTTRDGSDLYFTWVERATRAGWDPKTKIVGWEIRVLNKKDNEKDKYSHWEYGEEIMSWVNTGDIWYYGSTFEGWEFGYYNLALEAEGAWWAHNEDGKQYNPKVDDVPYLGRPKSDGYYSLKSTTNNSWGCKVSGNSSAGRNTFYLFNAIEALDAPGEWFYDKETGYLYLYPEDEHAFDLDAAGMTMANPTPFNLVSVGGGNNIIFDGLTLDGSSSVGLYISNADSIIVQDCTFRNTKGCNVTVANTFNSAFIYSDFSAAYSTLLNVSNTNSAYQLKPTNLVVQNCIFHDPMPLRQTAIAYGGCRMVVSHNYFNNTTTSGGNTVEAIIEYNRFEGGSKDITDGGFVYLGGSTTRQNHVRYNLFHMFNATHNAVYNDTMGSGNYSYYNVCSTLHSASDHNKPWYSSTGWGNVHYGNIQILRNPLEIGLAGAVSSMESEDGVFNKKDSGDMLNESALFYYYFGDEHAAADKRAWKAVDGDGNPQAAYKVLGETTTGTDGLSYTPVELYTNASGEPSQLTLSQSLAGHWWLGYKTNDWQRYLVTCNQELWIARAPEFINMMHGTKMLASINAAREAGATDYHVKNFYVPWYLCGKTYTFNNIDDGVIITIPSYKYLEEIDGVTYAVTVPDRHFTVEGEFTLTFEEIASMERARRAPMYSVVKNNVILGGTPIYKEVAGKFEIPENAEPNRAAFITTSSDSYQGFYKTLMNENNFMSYEYEDITPGVLNKSFDYSISDDAWELIMAAGSEDPNLTVEPEVLDILKELSGNGTFENPGAWRRAGLSDTSYDYMAWIEEIYPDFWS